VTAVRDESATSAESAPGPGAAPARERGLGWFYALLALTAGLFAFGALAWRPLKAAYWERETRAAYERGDVKAAADALDRLEAMGPAAGAAAGRLLAPNGAWYRGQVLQNLNRKENRWLLPALVRLARDENDSGVAMLAVSAAESMTGRIFLPVWGQAVPPHSRDSQLEAARARLIDWWEGEGRRKYGR